jgi:hypothetical protein
VVQHSFTEIHKFFIFYPFKFLADKPRLCRQLVTSDMTFSFFTGDLLVLFAAHKAASFGIIGEACRATGGSAVPMQYGVVTYRHGWLDVALDIIFFDRIMLYHTFYKQVLDMCLTKNSLLKSPANLTFRFYIPVIMEEIISIY